MKTNMFKMSVVTAILLSSGAYAGLIKGANPPSEPLAPDLLTQFGYYGWNLENVEVKIVNDRNFSQEIPGSEFVESDGTYTTMNANMSFESEILDKNLNVMGRLHGKDWPVGEPSGIKVINGDTLTKHGKAQNCIMTTSYLSLEDNPFEVYGYLDGDTPTPTICSSIFQTHKRFKVNMMPATVATIDQDRYGQPVELVFNLEVGDNSTQRYQVFQKINNYTGMRLDGYKIEVLDENNIANPNINFSLLISDNPDDDESGDIAKFSRGLWGPIDTEHIPPHFETDGFFDKVRAGFTQVGDNTNKLTGGLPTLGSNYEALFGLWLPSKWAPYGIFFDDDGDAATDAELVAFWGTIPNAPAGTAPAWHKGKDYDLTNGDQSWAEPTSKELLTWTTNPLYAMDHIEDTLNLGLDYVVMVGENSKIGSKFTIRITPHVAKDQTAPNYIEDDNVTYIEPPTSYVSTAGVVTISPEPTFTPGTPVYVGVADADLNMYPLDKEEVTITVTADTGDSESVTLTETDVNSGVFSVTLPTENSTSAPVPNNGIMTVIENTVLTATYVDTHYGDTGTTETLTAQTTAKTPVAPTVPDASGGGGCTYNPNSKSFDMTFLLMMALGLLYPWRRRLLK